MNIETLTRRIISTRKGVDEQEALQLAALPARTLLDAAAAVTSACVPKIFDSCSIVNAKSGRCPEDCKWCAQSAHFRSQVESYPLMETPQLVKAARYSEERGIGRFSIVTSGKRLSKREVASLCQSVEVLRREVGIRLCLSAGLLDEADMTALHQAGISRYHCNLETSPSHFGNLCTTHTQEQKIRTLMSARKAGMDVCSGGIMGMGETLEQRIELAFVLRTLEVSSIPLNILSPIKGTPLESQSLISEEEILKTIALFRLILPEAWLRFAGGRARLSSDAVAQAYRTGINASIMGDMLTTVGADIHTDMERIRRAGYVIR